MKRSFTILAVLLVFAGSLSAQSYFVHFTDKGENVKLLDDPYSFLSPKAVSKKALRHVEIDHSDLPVSKAYTKALVDKGFRVKMKSRWFNFAVVEGGADVYALEKLPFVKEVSAAKAYGVTFSEMPAPKVATDLTYGLAQNQIEMVAGDYLHKNDYLGQGMTIAMMDGGYNGARALNGLDSLWLNGRILGTYNFVQNDTNIFDVGSHGTKVLSIMGGWLPGQYAGAAVKANYWLLKTEDELSETVSEMYNWLAGAEFADSVGADIISSSLGYYNFDGGIGDYDYEDLNGDITVVTKAADMAARKGLLVVVSAGNEGGSNWQKITAPADGDSVLAVGAVGPDEHYASFSSTGPTADGRIKPDVVAQGEMTAYLAGAGPVRGNGTSFSCPIIAGLAACLWQTDTTRTNMEIYQALRSTADNYYTPDNILGYGVANFRNAAWTIGQQEHEVEERGIDIFPNPVKEELSIRLTSIEGAVKVVVKAYGMDGRLLLQQDLAMEKAVPATLKCPEGNAPFILTVTVGDKVFLEKIIR